MRLKSAYIRFYKSFNYNSTRKTDERVNKYPWDFVGDQFYPYVEVRLDTTITAIVGANESGKSHLLSAIEKGITGSSTSGGVISEIGRRDFCRYSHFFKSAIGGPRLPGFGFEFTELTSAEKASLRTLADLRNDDAFQSFFLFRSDGIITVYIPQESKPNTFKTQVLDAVPPNLLPHVFRIESDIALPESVPINQLIEGRVSNSASFVPSGREYSYKVMDALPDGIAALSAIGALSPNSTIEISAADHQRILNFRSAISRVKPQFTDVRLAKLAQEFNLAHDLLFKVAKIDPEDIKFLSDALHNSETGNVRSVVDNVNSELAKVLNFPRVWAQDRNFALKIEATEHDLSFVVSDRTGRHYSFDERSSGLKHFLSYYIQYLAHEPTDRCEVLLMDEPDAFLSGEAQQDLVKIFQMFSEPKNPIGGQNGAVQVIYVTHSPFLIDKNHCERVRAMEKPEGTRGTRVIEGAAQNHYEPLRSAFGQFVGETTFISQCNLMVEGPADQILLAGASNYLRRYCDVPELEMLDLNRLTIVPCGGATDISYMVYLARGRDAEKPAVIVLLDSDKEGNDARSDLGQNGPHPRKKRLIPNELVLQLGDICPTLDSEASSSNADNKPFTVLEDLVPMSLAVHVSTKFARGHFTASDADISKLQECSDEKATADSSPLARVNDIMSSFEPKGTIKIGKVQFARMLVDVLPEIHSASGDEHLISGIEQFEVNMRCVFKRLRKLQIEAEQDTKDARMRQVINDKINIFVSDFSDGRLPTRDEANILLTHIDVSLDGDEPERQFISQKTTTLRRTHRLSEDPSESVTGYADFLAALDEIKNAKELAFDGQKLDDASKQERKRATKLDQVAENPPTIGDERLTVDNNSAPAPPTGTSEPALN